VETREEAAKFTNRNVGVRRDQLVKLPEGVHYAFELVDSTVYLADSGRAIGKVTEVLRYPANDVYVIKLTNGKEVLFPAVTEFVEEIDAANKKITVQSAGLLDEDWDKTG